MTKMDGLTITRIMANKIGLKKGMTKKPSKDVA